MKYKVGDFVKVKVEVHEKKRKNILIFDKSKDSKIEEMEFEIVGVNVRDETYKIIIAEDINGWKIGKFHVEHEDIDKKHIGKCFYDLSESLIV